jgi:hypothetical protein
LLVKLLSRCGDPKLIRFHTPKFADGRKLVEYTLEPLVAAGGVNQGKETYKYLR